MQSMSFVGTIWTKVHFAQLSLVLAPRPNVVEGRPLLLDMFIYVGCTDNAQKWWQVIASRRTVFATAGTDVRICAWLAAFCQLQLSCRQGPGVPCAVRQATSAQEQGLVRQAQVTQRVDSGGPRGCGAGKTMVSFLSLRICSDMVREESALIYLMHVTTFFLQGLREIMKN